MTWVTGGAGWRACATLYLLGVRGGRQRRAHRLIVAPVAVALICALTTACGHAENTSIGVPPNTIMIDDFSFVPGGVVVRPATTITVINRGSTPHTVTAVDKLFDSGPIAPGQRVTITAPAVAGKYRYLCMFHEYLTGFVSVTAPSSPPAPRPGTP